MRWRPCFVVLFVLVVVVGSVATLQSADDPEILRRELAAERARLEEHWIVRSASGT